jgi:hypothetical protein
MKQIEQLHIEIEEFRTKIKNVLDERLIELTDEGYTSEFWITFTEYDRLGKRGITPYYFKKNNFFDEFTIQITDRCELYTFLEWKKIKMDEYITVLTEYLNTIKDVGEYFEYDVFVYANSLFTFKKKK